MSLSRMLKWPAGIAFDPIFSDELVEPMKEFKPKTLAGNAE